MRQWKYDCSAAWGGPCGDQVMTWFCVYYMRIAMALVGRVDIVRRMRSFAGFPSMVMPE